MKTLRKLTVIVLGIVSAMLFAAQALAQPARPAGPSSRRPRRPEAKLRLLQQLGAAGQ